MSVEIKTELNFSEENMVKYATDVLVGHGYTVVEITRDSYHCPNVKVDSPYGPKTGCVIYPSGSTAANRFEFLVS